MSADKKPVRILHVVGGMNRGGAETWLMHVLHHIDRERFHMDFLVHTTQPCAYDDEIRALGSDIIPCLEPHRPLLYARNFWRILREHGPYDVVHSHVYLFSGLTLYFARRQGVGIRIANIYPTGDVQKPTRLSSMRSIYRWIMTRSITRNATHVLFDSSQAKDAFVRMIGGGLPMLRVLHCGIDLAPFQRAVDVHTTRAELGIPIDAKVVLTVARYVPHKNHHHLVEIACQVTSVRDDVVFLLVGDGPLYPKIQSLVHDLGLTGHFRFVQSCPDIVPLYKSADLFLFPSLMEGFGLVVVEAAASGLPIVASFIPGIVDSAQASPAVILVDPSNTAEFVAAILNVLSRSQARRAPVPALLAPFDISTSVKNLMAVYETSSDR